MIFFSGLLVRFRPLAKKAWLCCAFLLALVYLDFRLPEEFAQIAPLQSFPRLLPELSLIPLAPIVLSLVIAALILIILISAMRSNAGALIGLATAFSLVLLNINPTFFALSDSLPNQWIASPSRFVTNFFKPEVLKMAQSNWTSVR